MKNEKEKNHPAYFGIITAEVRYDEKLPDKAKIMFSEVTALSNMKGYCSASNGYFAELYNRDATTVSRWFSALRKRGHVAIELIYEGKEVAERRIFAKGSERFLEIIKETEGGVLHSTRGGVLHSTRGGIAPSVKENNTPLPSGKGDNNKKGGKPPFVSPDRKELGRYMHGRLLLLQRVVTGRYWAVYEADKFLEYYEGNGWKVGKQKMKDWKKAAEGWIRRAHERGAFLKPCPTSPEFGAKRNFTDEREEVDLTAFVSPLDRVDQ